MRFPDLTAPFLLFLATTPVVGAPTDFQYVRQYNDQRDSSSTLHHRSPKALNKNSGPYDHQRRSVHTMPDVLRSKLTKRILAPAEVEAVAHDLFGAIKTKLKPGHTIADIHFTSLENGKFKATGISKNAEGHLHQSDISLFFTLCKADRSVLSQLQLLVSQPHPAGWISSMSPKKSLALVQNYRRMHQMASLTPLMYRTIARCYQHPTPSMHLTQKPPRLRSKNIIFPKTKWSPKRRSGPGRRRASLSVSELAH
ncbi:hypothetical protein FRB95_004824 [Tulasnella sp. JGI-2019a]|nr:hypothetical protein FRB95_004824 [Tulasnella sp. JGI-2019a]